MSFQDKLKSDEGTEGYAGENFDIEKEKRELLETFGILRQKYQRNDYPVVHGAFGEMENCDALPKEIDHEDGLKMRLYGTPYLYKGLSDVRVVAGLQFPKALFSSFIREIILKSWLNIAFLGFKYLFDRQSFLYSVYFLFHQIDQKVLAWYDNEFGYTNTLVRHVIKVAATL